MEDNKKMENQNVEAQENQEILVDGKVVSEQPKKAGVFQKIGNGIKTGCGFVWKHKGSIACLVAGYGLKCAVDWIRGGIAIDEASDEEIDDDSTEEESTED